MIKSLADIGVKLFDEITDIRNNVFRLIRHQRREIEAEDELGGGIGCVRVKERRIRGAATKGREAYRDPELRLSGRVSMPITIR